MKLWGHSPTISTRWHPGLQVSVQSSPCKSSCGCYLRPMTCIKPPLSVPFDPSFPAVWLWLAGWSPWLLSGKTWSPGVATLKSDRRSRADWAFWRHYLRVLFPQSWLVTYRTHKVTWSLSPSLWRYTFLSVTFNNLEDTPATSCCKQSRSALQVSVPYWQLFSGLRAEEVNHLLIPAVNYHPQACIPFAWVWALSIFPVSWRACGSLLMCDSTKTGLCFCTEFPENTLGLEAVFIRVEGKNFGHPSKWVKNGSHCWAENITRTWATFPILWDCLPSYFTLNNLKPMLSSSLGIFVKSRLWHADCIHFKKHYNII